MQKALSQSPAIPTHVYVHRDLAFEFATLMIAEGRNQSYLNGLLVNFKKPISEKNFVQLRTTNPKL